MSLVHVPPNQRGNPPDQQSTVQKLLDDNSRLIDIITEYQNQGRAEDAIKHQQLLHRNLLHLANLADPYLLQQLRDDGTNQHQSQNSLEPSTISTAPSSFTPSPSNNGVGPQQMAPTNYGPPPGMHGQQTPTHEMMQHYQRQQQGYQTFGQPGPQMPPGARMPGYGYPPQGMQGYPGGPPAPPPPQGYDGQQMHLGYPHPGQQAHPQQQQPGQHYR